MVTIRHTTFRERARSFGIHSALLHGPVKKFLRQLYFVFGSSNGVLK